MSTGQGDDYITGSLLDFTYFRDNYRLIAVDSRKEKALDAADLRAVQQMYFKELLEEMMALEKSK